MQKMVLVSFDRYQRLLSASTNETLPVEDERAEQKRQFSSATSGIASALQTEGERKTEQAATENSSHNIDIERLLTSFPKSLRGRAKALVTYILPNLTWNEREKSLFSDSEYQTQTSWIC